MSTPDSYELQQAHRRRREAIAKALKAGVTLDVAITTLDATGDLRDPFRTPNLTAAEAKSDFLAWVQEHEEQAVADAEDAKRYAAEVAELRALISR
jgi:hypothetical protein